MDVKKYNYIMLTIGLTIFSVVSIVATFGYKYYKKTDKSFLFIFFISLFFGILSYFIKIPLLYYYGDEHDTITRTFYQSLFLHFY
jgi:Na+-driven multidrug efflux pump